MPILRNTLSFITPYVEAVLPIIDVITIPGVLFSAYQYGFTMPVVADVLRRLMGLKSMIGTSNVSTNPTSVNIPVARSEINTDIAIPVTHPSESSGRTRSLPADGFKLQGTWSPASSDRSGPSRPDSV